MAKWITSAALILMSFLVFMNEVDFSAGRGRGGGFRGGSRFSRSRSSRSSGGSRAYKGSYGLTSSTWFAAFSTTRIYGGQRYLLSRRYRDHPDKMPTICRNTYASDDNGTVYNLFVCPRHNEPDNHEYCCGEKDREYCCKYFDNQWKVIVVAVSLSVMVLIGGIVAYYLYKKKICCNKEKKNPTPEQAFHTEMKEPGAPPPYTMYSPDPPLQTEQDYPDKSRI